MGVTHPFTAKAQRTPAKKFKVFFAFSLRLCAFAVEFDRLNFELLND